MQLQGILMGSYNTFHEALFCIEVVMAGAEWSSSESKVSAVE